MGDRTNDSKPRWFMTVAVSLLLTIGTPVGSAAAHDGTNAPSIPPALPSSLPAAPLGSGGQGDDVVETKWGPLGAADRDFLAKVRLAGLWELPAGQQALQKSQNPKIQEAGRHLIDGHSALDDMVRNGGQALGVELPNQPNSDQLGWLKELTTTQGEEYERTFANRLRAAHGKVYGFAAQVRAGTRNELVRAMANQTMSTVFDHISQLEKTGLVDFQALPSPTVLGASATPSSDAPVDQPKPLQRTASQATPTADSGIGGAILFVVIIAVIGGLALLFLRWQRKKSPGLPQHRAETLESEPVSVRATSPARESVVRTHRSDERFKRFRQ
ncbi:protein of unknown function [Lentzea albidocapillata subsp. violacea]|uniref:DUF4142 domain-containing protein n=1 Tax=Lentzea albidocapillata subsp. violacea TaxID=128104 RepID=A0A1G9S336_9PSEU|nr:DUF4142 domain-containing protein [Lentzea albidocapillata]SDM29814.1 protein of unknown function [Lentzea albidocapillata subsp. violacea]